MTANSLPNIPWQERPAGCSDVIWRYEANPIAIYTVTALAFAHIAEVVDFVKTNSEI
jgi:hypothetical protein